MRSRGCRHSGSMFRIRFCPPGGIGRRAGFRYQWLRLCEFKSRGGHWTNSNQSGAIDKPSWLISLKFALVTSGWQCRASFQASIALLIVIGYWISQVSEHISLIAKVTVKSYWSDYSCYHWCLNRIISSPPTSWRWRIQDVQRLLQCLHSVECSQAERLQPVVQCSQVEQKPTSWVRGYRSWSRVKQS